MKTKRHKQSGFTLIELMIVVAIIGILAAIAFPAFQTYIIRAKLIETIRFSDAAKTYLWEEYFTNAHMPAAGSSSADNVELMMKSSDTVSAATYTQIDDDNASLEITFHNMGAGADNTTQIFLFETDGNKITMDCRGGTMPDMYRPASCRSNS